LRAEELRPGKDEQNLSSKGIAVRKAKIDFLVIGAAKSGTTSLYKYLAAHRSIYIPPEKEIGFFSRPEFVAKGLDFYFDTWFAGADPTALWGDVSPQYMYYESAPRMIRKLAPDTRLIAILRNPIDRAYSHYQFARRRRDESASFEATMERLIDRGPVSDDQMRRNNQTGFREHIAAGEYGRILESYVSRFPAEQLKIVFFEDFVRDPELVTRDLYQWLGVERHIETNVFDRKYMTGGATRWNELRRIFDSSYKWASRTPPLPALAQVIAHRNHIRAFRRWFLDELTIVPGDIGTPTVQQRESLREYYEQDVMRLEALLQQSTPWEDFSVTQASATTQCA
jgi:hypothetical protein